MLPTAFYFWLFDEQLTLKVRFLRIHSKLKVTSSFLYCETKVWVEIDNQQFLRTKFSVLLIFQVLTNIVDFV